MGNEPFSVNKASIALPKPSDGTLNPSTLNQDEARQKEASRIIVQIIGARFPVVIPGNVTKHTKEVPLTGFEEALLSQHGGLGGLKRPGSMFGLCPHFEAPFRRGEIFVSETVLWTWSEASH